MPTHREKMAEAIHTLLDIVRPLLLAVASNDPDAMERANSDVQALTACTLANAQATRAIEGLDPCTPACQAVMARLNAANSACSTIRYLPTINTSRGVLEMIPIMLSVLHSRITAHLEPFLGLYPHDAERFEQLLLHLEPDYTMNTRVLPRVPALAHAFMVFDTKAMRYYMEGMEFALHMGRMHMTGVHNAAVYAFMLQKLLTRRRGPIDVVTPWVSHIHEFMPPPAVQMGALERIGSALQQTEDALAHFSDSRSQEAYEWKCTQTPIKESLKLLTQLMEERARQERAHAFMVYAGGSREPNPPAIHSLHPDLLTMIAKQTLQP